MALDPRRSLTALGIAWVAAGALGGGVGTLVAMNPTASLLIPQLPGTFAAFPWMFAAAAAVFQTVLLLAFRTGRWSLLWLPATIVGILGYAWFGGLWLKAEGTVSTWLVSSFGMNAFQIVDVVDAPRTAAFGVGLGVAEGLVLLLMTRRKVAFAIWVVANLVGWFAMYQVAGPLNQAGDLALTGTIANTIMYAVYSVPTALALSAIFRPLPRATTIRPLPAARVPS